MKIYVNEIPSEAKKCLFYEITYTNDQSSLSGIRSFSRCNINGQICDLFRGRNCNKLKLLTKE